MSALRPLACAYALPFDPPQQTAAGTFTARRGWWLAVEADGHWGLGEVAPWPGFGAGPEAVAAWMARPEGEPPPEVRAGLSLAVDDARARAGGVPLACNWGADPAALELEGHVAAASAEAAAASGAAILKIKVGAASLADDAARVAAIRAACPHAALRLDANGAWSEAQAHQAIALLAPSRPRWVEQALRADASVDAWHALHARALAQGIALDLDESLRHEALARALIAAGAVDGLVLKPALLGGFEAARTWAHRATAAGLSVCVTHAFDSPVGRIGALHAAFALRAVAPGLTVGLGGGPLGPGAAQLAVLQVAPGRWRLPTAPGLALGADARGAVLGQIASEFREVIEIKGDFWSGVSP